MDSTLNQYSGGRGRNGNQARACHQLIREERKERRRRVGEGDMEETMVTRRGWRQWTTQDLREVRAAARRIQEETDLPAVDVLSSRLAVSAGSSRTGRICAY